LHPGAQKPRAEAPAFAWRTIVRRRLVVAAVGLAAWSAGIEARLLYLQVTRHSDLTARAERQQLRTVETAAKRGEILDRNGRVLAYSVDADSIYAVPTDIDDPDEAASALCNALNDCHARERQALADRIRRGRAFAYVRRQAMPDEARRIAALGLDGIGFMKESRRFYPNKELAAHVLGYVGIDNNGLNGLEATYDTLIKGRPGTVLVQTDARRQAFSRIERPPTTGATLELTIDQYLQYIAERELRAGVVSTGAYGGSIVVMEPRTGEILALANYPTFNPNTYREHGDDERRNRAVQDLYEPGSTFKIVTAGAALEDRLLAPESPIDTRPGRVRFGARVIDEDRGHDYGLITFTDVIVRSSNVGAVKVALKLGAERMGSYVHRFGFGRRTSPDFPGESPGIVWSPDRLSDSALASVSMGYQVAVTPLQMAAAVSAVANGGELIEPRIVRAVIAGSRAVVPRKVIRRAVSPATAAALTDMMEQVVERGTGMLAKVPGFPVAGKTGTAQKVINGRYSPSDYNVSFVGFVPSRQPVFAIVVVIDSPRKVAPYGGTVAAPIFQRVADAALRLYGEPPSINPAPPVIVARDAANQQPVFAPATVPAIATLEAAGRGSATLVPDLRGLGARDALRTLARLGLTARVLGTGVVVDQDPPPGRPIERGAVSTLRLERHAGAAVPVATAAAPGGGQ
jgi:cell division protein FtsI (penicillin-binding protein 3)